jgi:hypothetical protein
MSILYEQRSSDSPYVETVTRGRMASDGSVVRPAEHHWHMVFARHQGVRRSLVVGPWTTAGVVSFAAGAELLWIKFTLGAFMPHLPMREILDKETLLPGAASRSFWLHGSAWQWPDYDNAETFVAKLVRGDVLVRDPLVAAVAQGRPHELASRTARHRFLRATGLAHSHIRQAERAHRAAALLERGESILDTVYEAGYFDQPHLTRALKRFIGKTPAQHIGRRSAHG